MGESQTRQNSLNEPISSRKGRKRDGGGGPPRSRWEWRPKRGPGKKNVETLGHGEGRGEKKHVIPIVPGGERVSGRLT